MEAEPFSPGQISCDDKAGGPAPVEDQLVEVDGLLGSEPVPTQVVEVEQAGARKGRKARPERCLSTCCGVI